MVFNSSKSRIKAAGAATAAVGVYCSWGAQLLLCVQLCSVTMAQAKWCPAPASSGEGGAEEEIWHLEPKKSSKFTCLSGSECPKWPVLRNQIIFRNGEWRTWAIKIRNLVWHGVWQVLAREELRVGVLLPFIAACWENWVARECVWGFLLDSVWEVLRDQGCTAQWAAFSSQVILAELGQRQRLCLDNYSRGDLGCRFCCSAVLCCMWPWQWVVTWH